eukprot:5428122-Amphidinium_carterae.1
MLWPLARPPAKERTGGGLRRRSMYPKRERRWNQSSTQSGWVQRVRVVATIGGSSGVNQGGESQPIASGNGILVRGSVSLQSLAC